MRFVSTLTLAPPVTRRVSFAVAARLMPWTLVAAASTSVAIVLVQALVQPPSPLRGPILNAALAAGFAALVLWIGVRAIGTPTLPRPVDERGATAYLFALQAGALLLPVAAAIAVWRNHYDAIGGWTYPFLNKRWLVALYGIGVATCFVLPSCIDRWLAAPQPWSAIELEPDRRSRVQHALGIAVAVLAAWYVAGPPWHVARHHRAIDFHEQVHLGPLQAIDKGYVPYLGPASTQYGPGAQLLTYGWMKLQRRFDIVSYREAQLLFHWVAVTIVAALAWCYIGLSGTFGVLVIGLAYSPLKFFTVHADGTFGGSYGWANELRHMGPLLVAPALARLAMHDRSRWRDWTAVGAGAAWGFFAWLAQENLGTTAVASALILMLLWATDSASGRSILTVALRALAGFATVVALVLLYYATHGGAVAFIRAYFLVASAVAMGFQNTWWGPAEPADSLMAYRLTAPFIVAIGIAALCDLPRLSLRRRLTWRRVLLLAVIAAQLASYQTVLYRSDSTHLLNALLALPFVFVLAMRDVPAFVSNRWPVRLVLRVAIAAAFLSLYPVAAVLRAPYLHFVQLPMSRFAQQTPDLSSVRDGRVAFRRATRWLIDEPAAAPGMVPMRVFLEDGSAIRDLIGEKRTYVDGVVAGAYTGLYYFMLDLTPGPALFEQETMTIHRGLADEAFDHFTRYASDFDAVLTATPDSRVSEAFRAAHPGAITIQRSIGDTPVYILLSAHS